MGTMFQKKPRGFWGAGGVQVGPSGYWTIIILRAILFSRSPPVHASIDDILLLQYNLFCFLFQFDSSI